MRYDERFGISRHEWRVLVNVGYCQELSVRDMETRTNLVRSQISRAATKLDAKGYLVKEIDGNDKRLLKLTLTKSGTRLLAELVPIALKFQAELDEQLGENINTLNTILDQLTITFND